MRLAVRILLVLTVLGVAGLWTWRRFCHRSAGIYARVLTESSGCDRGVIVLSVSKQRSVKINYATVPFEALGARLKSIYDLRYKRELLIRADPDLSFGEVMAVVDVAQAAVSDVRLVLLTPGVEKIEPCFLVNGPQKMSMNTIVPEPTPH